MQNPKLNKRKGKNPQYKVKRVRREEPDHMNIIKQICNFIRKKKRKNRDFILMSRINSLTNFKEIKQIFDRCKITRMCDDGVTREYSGIKAYIEKYGSNILKVGEYTKETKKGLIVKPIIKLIT